MAHVEGVEAIYLFGSRASGHAGPESDMDLAVLVGPKPDALAWWHLEGSIAERVGCDVDLVDIRRAATVLQKEVVEKGVLLWQRTPQSVHAFEAYVYADYADLQERRAGILADIAARGSIS